MSMYLEASLLSNIRLLLFGGYFPSILPFGRYLEAQDIGELYNQIKTIPQVPYLFSVWDWIASLDMPPPFHPQQISFRLGHALIRYKRTKNEQGEPVTLIPVRSNGRHLKFELSVFECHARLKETLQCMENPVDRSYLKTVEPKRSIIREYVREKGFYGYDLTGELNFDPNADPLDSRQLITERYISPSLDAGRTIINGVKEGTRTGLLRGRHDDNIPYGSLTLPWNSLYPQIINTLNKDPNGYKSIDLLGGRPKEAYNIALNGQIDNRNNLMPVMTPALLKMFKSILRNPNGTGLIDHLIVKEDERYIIGTNVKMDKTNGMCSWKYWEGVLVEDPNIPGVVYVDKKNKEKPEWTMPMPMAIYFPGGIIKAKQWEAYQKLMADLKTAGTETDRARIIQQAIELRNVTQSYGPGHYAIRNWNRSQTEVVDTNEEGQTITRKVRAHKPFGTGGRFEKLVDRAVTKGGLDMFGQEKVQYRIQADNNSDLKRYYDIAERELIQGERNSAKVGVEKFLKKVKGTYVGSAMLSLEIDIITACQYYLRGVLGEPTIEFYIKYLAGDVSEEKLLSYKYAESVSEYKNKVLGMLRRHAENFAQMISQLDIKGSGTRRAREWESKAVLFRAANKIAQHAHSLNRPLPSADIILGKLQQGDESSGSFNTLGKKQTVKIAQTVLKDWEKFKNSGMSTTPDYEHMFTKPGMTGGEQSIFGKGRENEDIVSIDHATVKFTRDYRNAMQRRKAAGVRSNIRAPLPGDPDFNHFNASFVHSREVLVERMRAARNELKTLNQKPKEDIADPDKLVKVVQDQIKVMDDLIRSYLRWFYIYRIMRSEKPDLQEAYRYAMGEVVRAMRNAGVPLQEISKVDITQFAQNPAVQAEIAKLQELEKTFEAIKQGSEDITSVLPPNWNDANDATSAEIARDLITNYLAGYESISDADLREIKPHLVGGLLKSIEATAISTHPDMTTAAKSRAADLLARIGKKTQVATTIGMAAKDTQQKLEPVPSVPLDTAKIDAAMAKEMIAKAKPRFNDSKFLKGVRDFIASLPQNHPLAIEFWKAVE